ncbi:MAG: GGDEF domain-containing protein [Coriobacteriia bacterium]|nr:GGDEF domain-containing protein [Coriobacteriia bacterium]
MPVGLGRVVKRVARAAKVSWREQPTQYDIEAIRANTERVGTVIRVRWALVGALSVFSVIAALVYAQAVEAEVFLSNMAVPAVALLFVLAYNAFYQATYRKLGNIAFLNHAQLVFDMVVVTVLVYYSGGVYSWFTTMYLLFVLEAAFILPRRRDVWFVVAVAAALYGGVLLAEWGRLLPHVAMPFVENDLWRHGTYVAVRYLWEVTMLCGAGTVGMLMMQRIREREQELRECSFTDELTGLFNRQYFHRVLDAEVERARRGGRELALVMADIDGLSQINERFGIDIGDEVLARAGELLRQTVESTREGGPPTAETACRVGGEEFAVVVPAVTMDDDGPRTRVEARAATIAEAFRAAMEGAVTHGVAATVSVSIALMPRDGVTADDLIDAADERLAAVREAGGNRVSAPDGGGDDGGGR